MNFKSGYFDLQALVEFAVNNPVMPNPKNKPLQEAYATLLNSIVCQVPSLSGWYVLGKVNERGSWETVSLGKSVKKKTSSLHTRLYDLLREDCSIAIWSEVYGQEPMILQHTELYHGKYNPARGLRKSGSQVVIWVVSEDTISEKDVERQKQFLMKRYRSTQNDARANVDSPQNEVTTALAKVIEEELKRMSKEA
ncbi:MAG TPA: hypothetical protein VFV38_53030 [Ktedonobacteraceae bacterium]|nr:hypothetical protein [Ktedonobacteraceae bacterium]